jgi:hypothetical protein
MIALIIILALIYIGIYIALACTYFANRDTIYESSTFVALTIWAGIGAVTCLILSEMV